MWKFAFCHKRFDCRCALTHLAPRKNRCLKICTRMIFFRPMCMYRSKIMMKIFIGIDEKLVDSYDNDTSGGHVSIVVHFSEKRKN